MLVLFSKPLGCYLKFSCTGAAQQTAWNPGGDLSAIQFKVFSKTFKIRSMLTHLWSKSRGSQTIFVVGSSFTTLYDFPSSFRVSHFGPLTRNLGIYFSPSQCAHPSLLLFFKGYINFILFPQPGKHLPVLCLAN